MLHIRTRFAPSPTGYLHIGNIRTALFNWLFAKKNNGKFILRIENTDLIRCKQKYIDHIFFILEWLGLYWDEHVYYQSKRFDIYKYYLQLLLNTGWAYKCYCTYDRLTKLKILNKSLKKQLSYDGYCRNKIFSKRKDPYVIRFKLPSKNIYFNDLLYSTIHISYIIMDDFIIQRSNGIPTYNFCVAVDDFLMNITHVIRGGDHINNTPKQIYILHALKMLVPEYIHLPIILDNNRQKLSKRNKISNVKYYMDIGILPIALLNYLLRLGWSFKNKELFSLNEMISLFNISNLNKSNCLLNISKLYWINKYHISSISNKLLWFYLKPFFLQNNIDYQIITNIDEIISYFRCKVSTLQELSLCCLLFDNNYFHIDKYILLNLYSWDTYSMLSYFLKLLNKKFLWTLLNIKRIFSLLFKKFFWVLKKDIFLTLRFFLTGKLITINLYIIILLLKIINVKYRLFCSLRKIIFLSKQLMWIKN